MCRLALLLENWGFFVMNQGVDKHLAGIEQARRNVVAKLVASSGFVPPVVVGFGMGISAKAALDVGPFQPNSTLYLDDDRKVA